MITLLTSKFAVFAYGAIAGALASAWIWKKNPDVADKVIAEGEAVINKAREATK